MKARILIIICFPSAFEGISVIKAGSDVTVHAMTEIQGVSYSLAGTTGDMLFTGGTYSGGTLKKTYTINDMITSVNF